MSRLSCWFFLALALPAFAAEPSARWISVSSTHALRLNADGSVSAWGSNGDGQLGDGTFVSRSSNSPVLGLDSVVQVYAAPSFSFALKSDGSVWAWGSNLNDALGAGENRVHTAIPVRVAGLADVIAIDECMALKGDGTVWA